MDVDKCRILRKTVIYLTAILVCVICLSIWGVNSTQAADSFNSSNEEINKLNKKIEEFESKTPNPKATKLTFKKIRTLKVTKRNLTYPAQLVKKIRKIKVNHGKVQRFDFLMTNYYRKNKRGKLVGIKTNKLHKGSKGILTMVVQIGNLKPGRKYTFLNSSWPDYDLDWKTSKANKKGMLPLSSYSVVKVPFVVKK